MKLCKDCINKGKKENCKIYTSMSNFAEKCKDFNVGEKRMLITKFNCDERCLSCGDKNCSTIKVSINRIKQDDNIVSFYLCRACLNQLAREFYPFS